MARLFLNMLQLILSPTHGWEDLSLWQARAGVSSPSGAYYAFLGLVSASWAIQPLYHPEMSWGRAAELALLTFATLFLSVYIATFILSVSLQSMTKGGAELSEAHVQGLSGYGVALLGLILLLSNCLPATTPILWFLPAYVLVILWKGRRYVGVRRSANGWYAVSCLLGVILPPMLIALLLKALL